MRLLLDTHVILWWARGDEGELGPRTVDLIDTARAVYVSPISLYEIDIKVTDGRLTIPSRFDEALREFHELPIRTAHSRRAAELPMIHRDPFDRILIAQAQVERLTLVTRDATIRRYDVDVLAV